MRHVMAAHGEDSPRRFGLGRLLEWFENEDEEAQPQVAYQTLEDEYLY